MCHYSDFSCKSLLQFSLMRFSFMFFRQFMYGFLIKKSEYLNVFLCILIRNVQPKLVEFVGRSLFGIKPYISFFCLTEFSTIGFSYQRTGKSKGFTTVYAPDELGT